MPGAPCGGHVSVALGLQADNLFVKKVVLGRGHSYSFSVVCATFVGTRAWPPMHCSLLSGPWRKVLSGENCNCFSSIFSGNSYSR